MFKYDPKNIVTMLETSKYPDLIPTRANMVRASHSDAVSYPIDL
jgi:hypothetical protein